MEKLAPIIRQKFWILLGVGIIMTFTGWWMATGTLAASVKDRTAKVKTAFDRIPSGEIPNNDWSSKLAARNTEQDRAVQNTAAQLWERQVSRMTWPEDVANFARNVPYRGEIPLAARENYRLAYGYDVRRVWESVHPYIQLEGTGLVVFGQNEKVLPQKRWGALAPTSADMWDAQEDLWLMESLLQAIVDVNGGPDAQRSDASIHAIEKFDIFGGVPAAQRKSSSAGGGGSAMPGPGGGSSGAHSPSPSPMGGFGSSDGVGGVGGPQKTQGLASADFDRKDEVGDDGSSRSGGAGGFGGGPAPGPSMSHGSSGAGPGPAGGGAAAVSTVRRYIEDDATLPFKTRGFYMTLIMDHRKIPSLIAELTASEKSAWPVEVVRVQMVRLHDDDIGSGIAGGGSSGGYPGGGYPGGRGSSGGISISSILSNTGTGATGFPGGSSGGYDDTPTAPMSSVPPGGYGAPGTNNNNPATSPAAAGLAALESSLQDPFMARVAILGYITLYKEVKPEAVVAAPGVPAAPAATAPAAVPTTPGAVPADSATPAETPEATTTPEKAPAEGDATEANPAKPGVAPGTVPETPAETPATTPEAGTKPAGEASKSP